MSAAIGFLSGLVFAVGLACARMTDPRKVLAFLDVAGAWDPSLLFVMGGAIPVFSIAYFWSRRLSRPAWAERFHEPTPRLIDARLILGAAIFGLGWGLAGYCPGPAFVSAAAGSAPALVFSLAMLLGFGVAQRALAPSPKEADES